MASSTTKQKYHWCSIRLFERIVGIVVLPCDQHIKVYAKQFAKLLGFDDLQQYIDSYPGQFKIGSSTVDVAIDQKYSNIDKVFEVIDNQIPNPNSFFNTCFAVYIECEEGQNNYVEKNIKRQCFHNDGVIVTTTLKEAQKMYGSKPIPKKEIWLCGDWIEPQK